MLLQSRQVWKVEDNNKTGFKGEGGDLNKLASRCRRSRMDIVNIRIEKKQQSFDVSGMLEFLLFLLFSYISNNRKYSAY